MNIDTNDPQYIDFDSEAYYARYLDIARAFYRFQRMARKKEINAKMFAWKHYVLYGRQEGRLAEFKSSHDEEMKKEKGEKEDKVREKDEFVITSKETFREACMRELPHARSIIIPKSVGKEPRLETVLIEFRWLPHLEFLVRNMVIKLHHWNHTIVCGNNNFQEIQTMRDSICPDIRIIHMDIGNLVPSTYSELLMTKPFWEQFHGEKLLIYQEDSFLFHEHIEPFLDYDYVGAPWPKNQDDNKLCVGNGGFSLRTKDIMIQVIENVKMESLKLGKNTIDYMKNTNSFVVPEDVYFTKAMIDFKIGWVAPWEIARKFSQEAIPSENPLGGHNFFLGNHEHNNLMIHANVGNMYPRKICLVDNKYYLSTTHRGGWKSIIQHGITKDFISDVSNPNNLQLIDCCEHFFHWNNKFINGKWYGICHLTHDVPKTMEIVDIDKLLHNETFIQCLQNCKGIIVLSEYMKTYFENKDVFVDVPIYSLKHPVGEMTKQFDIDMFLSKKKFSLILLGQQLRKISEILFINGPIIQDKIWLSGTKDKNKCRTMFFNDLVYNNVIENEEQYEEMTENINIPYLNNFEEYDELICNNIVMIPLYNASANNSVLEIIQTNIPAFVTRLPATEEYLGKDYPMFYSHYDEINEIIQTTESFVRKCKETHAYLKSMDKSAFTFERFYSDLMKVINEE